MGGADQKSGGWKEKISHEMIEYGINVIYLTLMFAAFTQYRRLILAAHDIIYTNYWVAVIQALIFGKVIMIGGFLRLGKWLEQKPLIFPTLYKAVVFTILVVAFNFVEHALKGLLKGEGIAGGVAKFLERWPHELLAGSLIVFVALVPFFAVKELGRIFGENTMRKLFFRERPAQSNKPPGDD
ncbi:MAG: hypothetical protein WCA83_09805 [Azonexus sp.]